MGEYVKHNGQSMKIGTCEDLYYTTINQFKNELVNMKFQEGNDQPENYLKPDIFRFRFPFPDEDKIEIGNFDDFRKGFLMIIPKSLGVTMHHTKIFVRTDGINEVSKGAPAVGIEFPCVQSDGFSLRKYDWSNTADKTIFEIIQQKIVTVENGIEVQTCIRCPYCGAVSRLDKTEANAVNTWYNSLKDDQKQTETLEILFRMVDGYYQDEQDPTPEEIETALSEARP